MGFSSSSAGGAVGGGGSASESEPPPSSSSGGAVGGGGNGSSSSSCPFISPAPGGPSGMINSKPGGGPLGGGIASSSLSLSSTLPEPLANGNALPASTAPPLVVSTPIFHFCGFPGGGFPLGFNVGCQYTESSGFLSHSAPTAYIVDVGFVLGADALLRPAFASEASIAVLVSICLSYHRNLSSILSNRGPFGPGTCGASLTRSNAARSARNASESFLCAAAVRASLRRSLFFASSFFLCCLRHLSIAVGASRRDENLPPLADDDDGSGATMCADHRLGLNFTFSRSRTRARVSGVDVYIITTHSTIQFLTNREK